MAADPPPDLGALDGFVEARRRDDNLPGVALAVVAGGEVVACRAWGAADLRSGAPLPLDAVFRVGSLTKLVTAATALRLVERGTLRLDDPVLRYVPWLAAGEADLSALTLRHLLAHRSGLPRGPYARPIQGSEEPRSTEDRLRDLAGMSVAFPPGERAKYSNLGYALAAHALAQAAGRPFHDLARELVLAPAGMEGASFGAAAGPLATGHQRGHYRSLVRRGDRLEPAPDLPAPEGAGDLVATARDLARLASALLSSRFSFLAAASQGEISRPQGPVAAGALPFGLAVRIGRRFGRRCLEHDGGHAGFFSLLRAFPRDGVAGVVLANRCSAYYPLDEILDRALAPLVGAADRRAPGLPLDLGRHAGGYASPEGGLRVSRAGDRLALEHAGETVALTRHGRGRFVQEGGPFSDYLLRFAPAAGDAWECSAGPRRWVRDAPWWPLLWEGPAEGTPAVHARLRALAGVYHRPGFGDARVYVRQERLLLSLTYAEEEELSPAADGGFRLEGGAFAGEPVRFEIAGGSEAVALQAGHMRFERRESLQVESASKQ